ncbi:purine-nucleoside phosphorylase [Thermophilibacter immobilis]|uniref:Uridine phosphorylase n=1 Tax=Thermophilibacter immobilis TaxID=2779519 RepID=A0A7S7M9W4_9ACTN|nr:purine-nucleoside phosphorylase [Thermophilibacter immobilis]QOY60533.1 purine-nucleoside phosphorylase [Thermophilibacter immobilis]
MALTPTPHNAAAKGQIAKMVLMPGDPLRAQFVAQTYLEDVDQFNSVRGMLGYTGTYQGARVSVMGSGMGMPSIGIYSYELFNFYDVDAIIRIGTAGGLAPDVQLRDLVMGMGACTDSNYAAQFHMPGTLAPLADFGLLRRAVEVAEQLGFDYKVGNVLSSDVFYNDDETVNERWARMGVLAVEMESVALYLNALRAKKRAVTLLTVSDLPLTGASLPAEERQTSFTQMMEVALGVATSDVR